MGGSDLTEAVVAGIGAARTGLRISPANTLGDIEETDPAATYAALVDAIEPLGLAYLHVMEASDIREAAHLAAWCDLPAPSFGPFNTADRATFYGGDAKGYTDYPALTG